MKRRLFSTWTGYGLWAFLLHAQIAWSQPAKTEPEASYYLNLNQGVPTTVHELQEGALNLQYEDRLGRAAELPLTVYNWKREPLVSYRLAKTYGSNYFRIDLGPLFAEWVTGETYTVEARDESGQTLALCLRKIEPVRKELPNVRLVVNPVRFSCREPTGNAVEFHGEISGGKAPYQVNWYVLDEERTNFLYQPREQRIEAAGSTAVVTLDKNPNYYVLMRVQDACGSQRDQMVYLECPEKRRRVHTLFVEPLRERDLLQVKSPK
ncbi:hypothetical protein IC235_15100 [Hymenobacter sp. BT664]|uniref:Ig-like domain-containing protein n=1 Tax=Hymenobacter montanus TaxID=2771359 RepID=A0A927BFT2_9BACT|nr:hypothetical protein [Hymenobacter montanus]MBD2769217.1 hypothetical protein [Hymenobacter montanus]